MSTALTNFVHQFSKQSPFYISLQSAVFTSLIVPLFSLIFHGRVTYDYMITGIITSLIVSNLFLYVIHLYQKKLRNEIEEKTRLVEENQQLIQLLENTLRIEKSRNHPAIDNIKEEKLKTIKQLMHKVEHHVGNLSHHLQLIEIQIKQKGWVPEDTLKALKQSIAHTSIEMNQLANINDPFDEQVFQLNYRKKPSSSS